MYLIEIFDVNKLQRIARSKGTGYFDRRQLQQLNRTSPPGVRGRNMADIILKAFTPEEKENDN